MGVDFGVIWVADFNNVIRFYVRRRPKDIRRPPSHQNSKEMTQYIVMGIDFGVIWVAYFNNVIRFYVRLPARRPRVTRRPPSQQNSKMTDIVLWVSILGIFGSLISIMILTVCPGSSDPFNIVRILYKMGHYFLYT